MKLLHRSLQDHVALHLDSKCLFVFLYFYNYTIDLKKEKQSKKYAPTQNQNPKEILLALLMGVRIIFLSQPFIRVILIILINVFLMIENSAQSWLSASEA